MQINLRDLAAKKHQIRLNESVSMEHLLREREAIPAGPLQTDVTATALAGVAEVTGELQLPMEFVCSRCLSRYCQTLRIDFREAFTQNPDQAKDEEDEIHLVHDERVELQPYFEEAVILAVPYAPVCEDSCKGLNPETGENLNVYPAEQTTERIDPRLAALADYFNKPD